MGIKLYVADNARFMHELEVGDCVLPIQERFDKADIFNHYQTEDGRVGILSHQEIRAEVVEEGGYDFTYSLKGGALQPFKTGDIVQLHPACVDKDGLVLQDLYRVLVYSTRVPDETLMVRPCDLMLVLSGPSPTGMKSVKELEVRYFIIPNVVPTGEVLAGEEVYPVEDGFFQSVKNYEGGGYLCPEEVVSVRSNSRAVVAQNAGYVETLVRGEEVFIDLNVPPFVSEVTGELTFYYRPVNRPGNFGSYLYSGDLEELPEITEELSSKLRYFVSATAAGIGSLHQGEEIYNIREWGGAITAISADGDRGGCFNQRRNSIC